jgi:hypothetical protein
MAEYGRILASLAAVHLTVWLKFALCQQTVNDFYGDSNCPRNFRYNGRETHFEVRLKFLNIASASEMDFLSHKTVK